MSLLKLAAIAAYCAAAGVAGIAIAVALQDPLGPHLAGLVGCATSTAAGIAAGLLIAYRRPRP